MEVNHGGILTYIIFRISVSRNWHDDKYLGERALQSSKQHWRCIWLHHWWYPFNAIQGVSNFINFFNWKRAAVIVFLVQPIYPYWSVKQSQNNFMEITILFFYILVYTFGHIYIMLIWSSAREFACGFLKDTNYT